MCSFCRKSGAHKEENCIRNPASRNYGKALSQMYYTAGSGAHRRVPPPSRNTFKPGAAPAEPNAWSDRALGEETRLNNFKTKESHEQQKQALAEAKKTEEPYEYTLKESFKRTGGRTVGDELGGKRIYEEVIYTERTVSTGVSATPTAEQENDEVKYDAESPLKDPVVEKKRAVVPPHLRPKKL